MKSDLKVAAIVLSSSCSVPFPFAMLGPGRREASWREEQAKVDRANTVLHGVHRDLMSNAEDLKGADQPARNAARLDEVERC